MFYFFFNIQSILSTNKLYESIEETEQMLDSLLNDYTNEDINDETSFVLEPNEEHTYEKTDQVLNTVLNNYKNDEIVDKTSFLLNPNNESMCETNHTQFFLAEANDKNGMSHMEGAKNDIKIQKTNIETNYANILRTLKRYRNNDSSDNDYFSPSNTNESIIVNASDLYTKNTTNKRAKYMKNNEKTTKQILREKLIKRKRGFNNECVQNPTNSQPIEQSDYNNVIIYLNNLDDFTQKISDSLKIATNNEDNTDKLFKNKDFDKTSLNHEVLRNILPKEVYNLYSNKIDASCTANVQENQCDKTTAQVNKNLDSKKEGIYNKTNKIKISKPNENDCQNHDKEPKRSLSGQIICKFMSNLQVNIESYNDSDYNDLKDKIMNTEKDKLYIYSIFFDEFSKIKEEFIFLIFCLPEINALNAIYLDCLKQQDFNHKTYAMVDKEVEKYIFSLKSLVNAYKTSLKDFTEIKHIQQSKFNIRYVITFLLNNIKKEISNFRICNAKLLRNIFTNDSTMHNYNKFINFNSKYDSDNRHLFVNTTMFIFFLSKIWTTDFSKNYNIFNNYCIAKFNESNPKQQINYYKISINILGNIKAFFMIQNNIYFNDETNKYFTIPDHQMKTDKCNKSQFILNVPYDDSNGKIKQNGYEFFEHIILLHYKHLLDIYLLKSNVD